jgi:hypothetical protein
MKKRRSCAASTLLAIFLAGCADQGVNVPSYGATEAGASVLLSNADGKNAYSGVVRVVGSSTCSGVFVAQAKSVPDDAPAYVLTNGHCADAWGANEVIVDRAVTRYRAVFGYFADTQDEQYEVGSRRVALATMKGQDVAVIELDATHGELRRRGFDPWRPASGRAAEAEPIVVVGAPVMAEADRSYLRLASCRLRGQVSVLLERQWTWFSFDRSDCTDIYPGSSGSPVISRESGRLLGLVNTTTIGSDGLEDCYIGRPCEAEGGSTRVLKSTSYLTPVTGVESCFDEGGLFQLGRPECPLEDGRLAVAEPSWLGAVNPNLAPSASQSARLRWDVAVTGPFPYYSYKTGAAGAVDCRQVGGYSAARAVGDQPVIADQLPTTEGHYSLCLLGGDSRERGPGWQRLETPTVVAAKIDKTPPTEARVTVRDEGTQWRAVFDYAPPELSAYVFKSGRPDDVRCEATDGYRQVVLPFYVFSKSGAPYRLCAIALDEAGNASPPFETLLR